jgi:hypothetical protein
MAIQISYPTATSVTLSDRLLGTQYDPETGSAITKNFSVGSVVNLITPYQLPYKIYTATFSQNGESDPVPIVLENTLGGDLTWTWVTTGYFSVTSNGLFIAGKTTMTCSNLFGNFAVQPYPNYEESTFPDVINILNIDSSTLTQVNGIDIAYIEIRVYN